MSSDEQNTVFRFDERHLKIMSKLFTDLTVLYDHDKEAFLDFFCNRDARYNELTTFIESVETGYRSKDFFIVGQAGVGKTSFIYRLASDKAFLKRVGLALIVVDYRTALPMTAEGCMLRFIGESKHIFRKAGLPIHTRVLQND